MHPDEAIIEAVLKGDRDRYAALIDRYSRYTHALAYSYMKDAQAAEDAAQEAFVKAFAALRTLAAPQMFGAWLAQITRNLCRAKLRRKQPSTVPLSRAAPVADPSPDDLATREADRQLRDVLAEALEKLPLRLREPIILFYLHEQPIRDIAGFLGASENSIRQRLHRARNKLRKHLDESVRKELGHLTLSNRFTSTVMAALPSAPGNVSWGLKTLTGVVSWVWFMPVVGSLMLTLLVNIAVTSLILPDVKPEHRPAFRKAMRRIGWAMMVFSLVVGCLAWFTLDLPWLCIGLLAVLWIPSLFGAHLRKSLALSAHPWRAIPAMLILVAMYVFLGLVLFYPYQEHWSLLLDAVFLLVLWPAYRFLPKMVKPEPDDGIAAPGVQPVVMEYLERHAVPFARVLNANGQWIDDLHIERDHVVYISRMPRGVGWLMRFMAGGGFQRPSIASPGGCRFELRVFADGRVEAKNYYPATMPLNVGRPEVMAEQLAEQVRRKWAFYQIGDVQRAKRAGLLASTATRGVFKPGATFWRSRALSYALFAVMLGLMGHVWYRSYIARPTLTAERVQQYYEGPFLKWAAAGFPDEKPGEPDHAPGNQMAIYYHHPPSMMDITGLPEVYWRLQRSELPDDPNLTIRYHTRQLINGVEAGYLTVSQLQSWGLTRERIALDAGQQPDWAQFLPSISTGQSRPEGHAIRSEMKNILLRGRLLKVLGLLDLLDAHIPEKVMKQVDYRNGAFSVKDDASTLPLSWYELETTCYMACLIDLFQRWDLADRNLTRKWIVNAPRKKRFILNGEECYLLGLAVVAVGGEHELPLATIATYNRPRYNRKPEDKNEGIGLYDIGEFAVNDILSHGQLLELRRP